MNTCSGSSTSKDGADNSGAVEQRETSPQVAGSTPAPSSNPQYAYLVLRKELTRGSAVAMAFHAGRDSTKRCAPVTDDEHAVILGASRAEVDATIERLIEAEHPHAISTETEGPLANSISFVTFTVAQKSDAARFVGDLKPYRG